MDHATLMVYRGPAHRPLAAWLISQPFRVWLVGALDGKIYPSSEYFTPVHGNDAQLRALARALAPKPPSSARSVTKHPCTRNESLNFFNPCAWQGPMVQTSLRLNAGVEYQEQLRRESATY